MSYNRNHRIPKKTTCGWVLLVDWKDGGSQYWLPHSYPKGSNPMKITKYAVANRGIDDEPAFN